MAVYGMVIRADLCVGCLACRMACQNEHQLPSDQRFIRNVEVEVGEYPQTVRQFVMMQCQHCEEAPCIAACPNGSSHRLPNGIVVVNEATCVGCGYCIEACPYEARYLTGEPRVARKCDLCKDRLLQGRRPACVETCLTGARVFGKWEDPESPLNQVMREGFVQRLTLPALDTKPNVLYGELEVPVEYPQPVGQPLPAFLWARLLRPLLRLGLGATLLGAAVAYAVVLVRGASSQETDHGEEEE